MLWLIQAAQSQTLSVFQRRPKPNVSAIWLRGTSSIHLASPMSIWHPVIQPRKRGRNYWMSHVFLLGFKTSTHMGKTEVTRYFFPSDLKNNKYLLTLMRCTANGCLKAMQTTGMLYANVDPAHVILKRKQENDLSGPSVHISPRMGFFHSS